MLGLVLAILGTVFTVTMILLFERRRARQIERDLGPGRSTGSTDDGCGGTGGTPRV